MTNAIYHCKLLSLLLLGILTLMAHAAPVDQPEPQGFDKMRQLSEVLSKRQLDYSIERNELAECKPVTVIFARGTIELGNVGSIAGPPFFNALEVLLGSDKIAVQGVDYPATIGGYLQGGSPEGASKAADLIMQAASQCPDTQIVLSGYSQGAQIIHLGVARTSPEIAARVTAVVCALSAPNRTSLMRIGILWRP